MKTKINALRLAALGMMLSSAPHLFGQLHPVNVTNIYVPSLDLAVSSHYLYSVGPGSSIASGFKILDISSPANPVITAIRDIAGGGRRVAVSGTYAYVLAGDQTYGGGLTVFDISNPANPIVAGHISGSFYTMAVSGDRVYLDGAIYDISNPASPVLLGQIPTSYYPDGGIALSGSYAFLAVNGQGLLVYDLSDPANPQKVAQKSTDPHFGGGGFGFGITVSGNYAYVATYTNCGVQVFDISTPTNPVSAFCVSTYAFDVRVFGNYAYPISTTTYFLIYNVSNPTNISAATEYVRTSDNVYTGAISGDYAYFGMGEYGITVYSLGIPPPTLSIAQTSTSTLLFSWPTPTTAFLLQQKPSLATGGWVTLTNLPATTASKNEVLIPAPAATTFYRLIPQ